MNVNHITYYSRCHLPHKNKPINDNLEQQAQAWLNELLDRYANSTTVLIHEIAEINPKRNLSKGTSAKCIEMANLPTTGSFPNGWIEKEYNGGMKFCNGDTLIARITPCLENGKTAFINFLDKNEIAYGSTEYIVISAKSNYSSSFFYFLARNHDFVDYAVKNMNGSSGRQRVQEIQSANTEFLSFHVKSLNHSRTMLKLH